MKTLESIREEIWEEMIRLEDFRMDQCADIMYQTLREVLQKLGHLDEPEVLSQEWIDEHTEYHEYIGYAGVPVEDLQSLLVPKQEKVKVPKFVGVVIELYKKYGNSLTTLLADLAYHGELQVDSIDFVTSDTMFDWADENSDTVEEIIARAWLDGYTVEEEPRYRIKTGNNYIIIKNDGSTQTVRKDNAVITKERLEQLPFDVHKAVESGIIEVEELEE